MSNTETAIGEQSSKRFGEREALQSFKNRRIAKAVNVADIKALALRKIPRVLCDFVEGGVEDELGLATNRSAFEQIRFMPHYGVDTSGFSLRTSVFGREWRAPFGIAPMGFNALYRPDGDLVLAQTAREAGIPFALSASCNTPLEHVASGGAGNVWFQLYGTRNREIAQDLVRRANRAGITTLLMTVDVPVNSRRERNIRNGMAIPFRPTFRDVVDAAMRPEWLFHYLRNGTPIPANWPAYADPNATRMDVWKLFNANMFDSSQTWEDVARIREIWPHKLVVKGILTPADAAVVKSLGADGLIVSNHGGRQLDRAPATIEMLPAVRAAVGEGMTVMLDSGVCRGSDIVAALCLGADFVFIGRSALYGLMAGGSEGVRKVITILREEMNMVLGQIGCADVSNLGPRFIRQ